MLILLAVTTGFALFGFMIALASTETRVVDAVRPDRLYVNARFDTPYGLPIALEEQLRVSTASPAWARFVGSMVATTIPARESA